MRALYDSKSKTIDDKGIKKLLTKETKYQTWLDVEKALALAQAELGVIPMVAAQEIGQKALLSNIDLDEVERIYKKIGHGFMPFLKVFVKVCSEESGKYIHYGVTTQNIQQTSQILIMKEVNKKIYLIVSDVLKNLAKIAKEQAYTVLAGRTHGQHALPITYGYKVAVWISELLTSIERMQESEKRIFTLMMGGAVGAFNSSGEVGRKVQNRVAELLGLSSMIVPSRNISYFKTEFVTNLALLASTAHKIAEEVYYTSGSEYNEVYESFESGTVGSSTMPQKVNPKLSKGIIANSQKLYSLINPLLYSASRPFEGDSSSYMLQDGIIDESLELIAEILPRLEELTASLGINKLAMASNVLVTGGLINSEYVMMQIAKKLGKDKAHEVVYNIAMLTKDSDKTYAEQLISDQIIGNNFSKAEIDAMLEPKNYIGLSAELALELADKALQFKP